MCSHVKKQEVLFLCGEDTFLNQIFCKTLPNIPQLVVQLQGIPGLSWRMEFLGKLARQCDISINVQQQEKGEAASPLSSSIQLWTVSGGWVSFMCFKASSSSTSPVGASDLQITFANKWNLFEPGKSVLVDPKLITLPVWPGTSTRATAGFAQKECLNTRKHRKSLYTNKRWGCGGCHTCFNGAARAVTTSAIPSPSVKAGFFSEHHRALTVASLSKPIRQAYTHGDRRKYSRSRKTCNPWRRGERKADKVQRLLI